ncbi:metallophosphoesterase [Bordetella sp. LUAb4]|uniref:metallophosphoesterase n=1 Tax=Bordetella sp. LUAb4 TaxID=2843195 RepID=UPI001E589BD9|nr:metallophosphoesterase [Bordetella sp. LUAb4]
MRRYIFLIRIIFVGVLAHAYVGARLIPDAPISPAAQWGAVGFLLLSCLVIPAGFLSRRLPRRLSEGFGWIGLLLMGYFSSLFVLTLLRDLLLLAIWVAGAVSGRALPGAGTLAETAIAVPLLALCSSLIGLYNARRRAPVRSVDVPIAGLPAGLQGFTIAQITDVHVGPTIKGRYVDAIVDAVNALQADLIAVTGDVVDGSVARLSAHTQPLGRLQARHGAYLVTGNHEYYSGADAWVAEFERLGLNVLLNRHVVIDHAGARLVVAGVTDYGAGAYDPDQQSDPAKALAGAPADVVVRILLAHQPRTAFAAEPAGYTLQLSGHTHGGQFLPWNFFVRLQQPFTAGLRRLGRLWVYTSRGTGYWGPPKRVGAPSEITHIRLVAAR